MINLNKLNITDLKFLIFENEILSNMLEIIAENNKREKNSEKIYNQITPENIDENDYFQFDDYINLYLKNINKFPLLSLDEEKELVKKMIKGDSNARQKLINSNLKLVIQVAKKYINSGVPFLDLVEFGNIGLIKAIDKFNYKEDDRISTYAFNLIISQIIKGIANFKGFSYLDLIYIIKMQIVYNNFLITLKRKSTISDEEEMNLNKELEKLLLLKKDFMPFEIINYGEENIDLEIPDEESDFENKVINKLLLENINKLSIQEQQVIILRFGLNGEKNKTLEEVGKIYNITCERVRQIEKKALSELKDMINKVAIKTPKKKTAKNVLPNERLEKLINDSSFDKDYIMKTINSMFSKEDSKLLFNQEFTENELNKANIMLKKLENSIYLDEWYKNYDDFCNNTHYSKKTIIWLQNQRNNYRNNSIPLDLVKLLDAKGFVWDENILQIQENINQNVGDISRRVNLSTLINDYSVYGLTNLLIYIKFEKNLKNIKQLASKINEIIKISLTEDIYNTFILYLLGVSIKNIAIYLNISIKEVENNRIIAFNKIFSNQDILDLIENKNMVLKIT